MGLLEAPDGAEAHVAGVVLRNDETFENVRERQETAARKLGKRIWAA